MTAPPRALLLAWLALLALLALTTAAAYQPLGAFNTALALTIAGVKVLIVAAVFMELRERNTMHIAFALAGVLWLAILLWLAGADYASRPAPPAPYAASSTHASRMGNS